MWTKGCVGLTRSLSNDSPRRYNILPFLSAFRCLLAHGCDGGHPGPWGDLEDARMLKQKDRY